MLVQVRAVPKHRSTHISNYQSTEHESYERDENYLDDNSHVSSGDPFSLLEIVQAYPLLHKGLGHLAALYLLYFTCCSLLFILSQNYLSPTISVLAENLTENRLSFPSAPRWVRHSYLSKGLR